MDIEELACTARASGIPIIRDATARILRETLTEYAPTHILEIGTAVGYSGIVMLTACPTARLVTVEVAEDRYLAARENFKRAGLCERVVQILCDCTEYVRMSQDKFDFVFLDGPKGHYAEMLPYIDNMLVKGGVLFADDTDFYDKVSVEGNVPHKHRTIVTGLRAFREALTDKTRYDTRVLSDGDGIIIARKR